MLGKVRLGKVRLGKAMLGKVRLGKVMLEWLGYVKSRTNSAAKQKPEPGD